jgi:hypothetical protein
MKKSLFDRGFSGPMLAILAIAVALPGCASSFDLRKSMPWGHSDDKIHEPLKVTVFWSDQIENRADMDRGLRGFGGRLYFYGKDPDKAIKIKGDLVVYAFDETNRDPKNMVPDKKYVFPAKMLEKLYSKSQMGHSYSVWLPWDAVGGPQHEITLAARFTSEKGIMVASEPSKQLLPGEGQMPATALVSNSNNAASNFVQQASYQVAQSPLATGAVVPAQAVAELPSVKAASQPSYAAGTPAVPPGSIATTTIPVPYGILNRQSNPQHAGLPGPPPYQPPGGITPSALLPPGQSAAPAVVLPAPASMTLSPADQVSQKSAVPPTSPTAATTMGSPAMANSATVNSSGQPAPVQMQMLPLNSMQTNSIQTNGMQMQANSTPTYSTPSGLPPVGLIPSPAAHF